MPLKIVSRRTFRRTVEVNVPVDGGFEKQAMSATFAVVPSSAAERFNLFSTQGSQEFLRAAIVELGDLVGEDGKELSYSDAVRDAVIDQPYAAAALIAAYAEGMGGAKRGN